MNRLILFILLSVCALFGCSSVAQAIDTADFELTAKPVRLSSDEGGKLVIFARLKCTTERAIRVTPSRFFFADPIPSGWVRKAEDSSLPATASFRSIGLKKGPLVSDSVGLNERFATLASGMHSLNIAIVLLDETTQTLIIVKATCQVDILASDL